MKRITKVCLLLVCMLALLRLPVVAGAEDGAEAAESGGVSTIADTGTVWGYRINDDGEAVITSYNGLASNLEIPGTIDGKTVVEIGDSVFQKMGAIVTVNMPDTVTRIGNSAFSGCGNLKSIHISTNLAEIGYSAFKSTEIQELDFPDSVKTIGSFAFEGCEDLETVHLPSALENLGAWAFKDCTKLTEIVIPKTLTQCSAHSYYTSASDSYSGGPFRGCENLSNVTLEWGMTAVPQYLFWKCSGIQEITIPDTVTEIGSYAFSGSALREVVFSENLTEIGYSVFKSTKIQELDFPDSVKTIGSFAFEGCEDLETVHLPSALENLGAWAFKDCTKLTEIVIPKTLTQCSAHSYYTSVYDLYSGGPFRGCENLSNVTLEWGMTAVPQYLFWKCSGIQEITIPDTVTEIKNRAFSGSGLEKVTLSKNVVTIGDSAFSDTLLTEVAFPKSVTKIGIDAFNSCSMLESVILPSRLQAIGDGAFGNCGALASATIPKSLQQFYYGESYKGVFKYCENLETVVFEEGTESILRNILGYCTGLKKITLPNSVTTIQRGAFTHSSLEEIDFGNGLTTIGTEAFYATNLEDVSLPDTVTKIDSSAFRKCSNLTSVQLSENLEVLSESLFRECTALEEITIPDAVNTIKAYAFSDCTALKTVNFGTGLKTIEKQVFYGCTAMTQIEIPAGVTQMGTAVFDQCEKLTGVTIPDSVTKFSTAMFRNCAALTDVVLSKYMTSLPANTFEGCGSLTELVVSQSVTKIEKEAFKHAYSFATIYIPSSVTGIDASAFSYPGSLTIYGIEGSYAQTFAEEQGIAFKVWQTPTESVTLNMTTLELKPETSSTLYATITPLNSAQELTWTSDNPQVATVSETGVVTAVGTGYATITAQSGTVMMCCTVQVGNPVAEEALTRIAGSGRWDTAIKVADELKATLGVEKFSSIIVASGNDFADALAGSYLSTQKSAPILLSWGKGGKYASLDTDNINYIRNNLASGGTVYILGGTSAVPSSYETDLSGIQVVRLAGGNRYETNLAILKEAGVADGSEILVCTGVTFADSLSAAATGKPILLVQEYKGKYYGIDAAFLDGHNYNFTIIGGTKAVSENLVKQLAAYGKTYRLAGGNRFETSVMVAQRYFDSPDTVVLAYAWNYPDGLCGGALAYAMNAPLILTMDKYESAAAQYVQSGGIDSGYVLGGTNLISDATVDNIFTRN